jgi:hypothetical protein
MAGTIVASTINNDTGIFSTNNAYSGIAKAWVNYAPGSQTIVNSFNVSSVTYNATGDITINFATAMTNANYVTAGIVRKDNSGNDAAVFVKENPNGVRTVSACQVQFGFQTTSSSGIFNPTNGYVVFFGS